ncbi:hypothetical protein GCM10019059_44480 [Camelimonas fluminis]|nr:hypothetical protein GCM10019059_44480 [Camelimonas fluminis]
MEVSEAKPLQPLEDENNWLKRMLAGAMLENLALKDLSGKKLRRPPQGDKPFVNSGSSTG